MVASAGPVVATPPAAGARDEAAERAGEDEVVDAGNTPTTPAHQVVEPADADRDTNRLVSAASQGGCISTAVSAIESVAGPSPRLGRNVLRGKVEQYLMEHPDQDFGPHALSQLLGHSSGAITNVLIKLATAGRARQTQTQPRRFAASTPPEN